MAEVSFWGAISKAVAPRMLSTVDGYRDGGGWWYRILESFPGAWQKNVEVDRDCVLSYPIVYACMTLIASDIAKLRLKLTRKTNEGIWKEVTSETYSPVLQKPNGFQTRIQFFENWMLSKLTFGNAYILKRRDENSVVRALFVLDPCRVVPLVSDSGDIFYQLNTDNIIGLEHGVTVPASEIIHDRMNPLFHPLIGTSPIFAAGVAATQGLNIQNQSANFFKNQSQPGGILTAPGAISDESAGRLKSYWDENFSGKNAGKIAVVGDGLTYKALAVNAHDAQLIQQLKWTDEVICSVFHVPAYKVGVGPLPTYNNVQSLNIQYFSECLQILIESAELCLKDGLGMKNNLKPQFIENDLLRMDSVTQMQVLGDGIGKGILKIDEARKELNRESVTGGDTPYLQEQNYSLAALAKRDALPDPFNPVPAAPPANDNEAEARAAMIEILKGLR